MTFPDAGGLSTAVSVAIAVPVGAILGLALLAILIVILLVALFIQKKRKKGITSCIIYIHGAHMNFLPYTHM